MNVSAKLQDTRNESTTTRTAGGLDFTALGGKGGARSAPIVAGGTGCAAMTIPLYERDGLDFRT